MEKIYRLHKILWYGYSDQKEVYDDYRTFEEALGELILYNAEQNTDNFNQWNEKYPDIPMWISEEKLINEEDAKSKVEFKMYMDRLYTQDEIIEIKKLVTKEFEKYVRKKEKENK